MGRVLFSCVFLLLVSIAAASKEDSMAVHITAAHDTLLGDGWARYVYWQSPDGTISVQRRGTKEAVEIQQAVPPRKNSPLSSFYRNSENGSYQVVVSYLDSNGYIIDVACRDEGGHYVDWSTGPTTYKSSSGLAVAEVNNTIRKFYIDDEGFVMQATDDSATQLGPKAAKGSQVSVSVPVGSTDIHLFYLSENKSLASLTLNGSAWSAVLPPIPKFASDSKTSFAAAAWAKPSLIVRIFYINSDKVTSEWTLLDGAEGSWVNTADTIGTKPAAKAGEPVAASRSENGTGRYLEYFYTAPGGHINYLAKNYIDEPTFMIEYANFETPTSGLTKDQKISLGTGIVGGVIGIVSIIVAIILAKDKWKWLRWFRFSKPSQKQGYTHVAPVTSATAINRNSQGPPVPHAALP